MGQKWGLIISYNAPLTLTHNLWQQLPALFPPRYDSGVGKRHRLWISSSRFLDQWILKTAPVLQAQAQQEGPNTSNKFITSCYHTHYTYVFHTHKCSIRRPTQPQVAVPIKACWNAMILHGVPSHKSEPMSPWHARGLLRRKAKSSSTPSIARSSKRQRPKRV